MSSQPPLSTAQYLRSIQRSIEGRLAGTRKLRAQAASEKQAGAVKSLTAEAEALQDAMLAVSNAATKAEDHA